MGRVPRNSPLHSNAPPKIGMDDQLEIWNKALQILIRRIAMEEKTNPTGRYFLAGLAVGWFLGIFFAPKSGEDTRDYLSKEISRGHQHAWRKGRELRERAEDLIDRGKERVNQGKERLAAQLEEPSKDHLPERSKAKGA